MFPKTALIEFIKLELTSKHDALQNELVDMQHEKSNETKSSAGDKYETSREMMQQSENRLNESIAYIQELIRQINQLITLKTFNAVESGALVQTNKGNFFFGISLGKLVFKEEPIFVLSLNAPIGKAFNGKKVNDEVVFQNQHYLITAIE